MRTALLVGVDVYERIDPLVGCINDVKDMASYLVGIGVDTIRALCGADATRGAVMDALGKGIRSLQSGDELIVHFSGHGALLPGHNAVHAVLCPYDYDADHCVAIYDSDVAKLLKKLRAGARLTTVIDACYAGGLQPNFAVLNGVASAPPHRIRSFPPGPALAEKLMNLGAIFDQSFSDEAKKRDVVLMTACSIDLTAAEARFSRHTNGIFTHYLLSALNRPNPPNAAQCVLEEVTAAMHEFCQKPELHGNTALFNRPFLQDARKPRPPANAAAAQPIPTVAV